MSHKRGIKETQWPSFCLKGKNGFYGITGVPARRCYLIGTVTFAKRRKKSVPMLLGRIWEDKHVDNPLPPPLSHISYWNRKPEKKAHWFKTYHLPNLQKGGGGCWWTCYPTLRRSILMCPLRWKSPGWISEAWRETNTNFYNHFPFPRHYIKNKQIK